MDVMVTGFDSSCVFKNAYSKHLICFYGNFWGEEKDTKNKIKE